MRRRVFLIAVGIAIPCVDLHGQQLVNLRLQIKDEAENPIQSALVALLDSSSYVSDERLSSSLGDAAFRLRPGEYRIRVRRIGFHPHVSDPLVLTGDLATVLTLRSEKVALEKIVIRAQARCAEMAEGSDAALVWAEIDKGLRSSQLTFSDVQDIRGLRLFQRRYDGKGRLKHQEERDVKIENQRPFGAVDPSTLSSHGYIVGSKQTGWRFYGPDEQVLLSSSFILTHCFRALRDTTNSGKVGVSFLPIRGRKVSDISGEAWVSEGTGELERVEFRYELVGLPKSFAASGKISFGRRASGATIIESWLLRIPDLFVFGNNPQDIAAIGHYESGGKVLVRAGDVIGAVAPKTINLPTDSSHTDASAHNAVVRPGGRPFASKISVVRGLIADSMGHAISGVFVADRNTSRSELTNGEGKFEFRLDPPQESFALAARKIGFLPIDSLLIGDSVIVLSIVAGRAPSVIDTIRITAAVPGYDEDLDRIGFYSRRRSAVDGTFVTFAEIQKRNVGRFSQVLAGLSGVRITSLSLRNGRSLAIPVSRNGRCVMSVAQDNQRLALAASESIDDVVNVASIGGIEIYPSAASVPSRFAHLTNGCGLIVLWTRYQP